MLVKLEIIEGHLMFTLTPRYDSDVKVVNHIRKMNNIPETKSESIAPDPELEPGIALNADNLFAQCRFMADIPALINQQADAELEEEEERESETSREAENKAPDELPTGSLIDNTPPTDNAA